jgi:hypothetical protein
MASAGWPISERRRGPAQRFERAHETKNEIKRGCSLRFDYNQIASGYGIGARSGDQLQKHIRNKLHKLYKEKGFVEFKLISVDSGTTLRSLQGNLSTRETEVQI